MCIKSFHVVDHSPYFLTFYPLTKNQVFRKISSKALCIKGLWVWNFTGGWIFFLFFFHKAFFTFHKKCLFSPCISMVCEFGILLGVASFSIFFSFNEKSAFWKKCHKTLYISRIRWTGVFGLKPEHAKIIFCFNFVTSPSISREKHIF